MLLPLSLPSPRAKSGFSCVQPCDDVISEFFAECFGSITANPVSAPFSEDDFELPLGLSRRQKMQQMIDSSTSARIQSPPNSSAQNRQSVQMASEPASVASALGLSVGVASDPPKVAAPTTSVPSRSTVTGFIDATLMFVDRTRSVGGTFGVGFTSSEITMSVPGEALPATSCVTTRGAESGTCFVRSTITSSEGDTSADPATAGSEGASELGASSSLSFGRDTTKSSVAVGGGHCCSMSVGACCGQIASIEATSNSARVDAHSC